MTRKTTGRGVKVPFEIDLRSCQSLTDQILFGFREAIAAGVYRPDERLPSIRSVAAALGVSEIVVRSAYARLAKKGIVGAHARRGTIVMPKKGLPWRGHVLCAMTDFDYNPQMSIILPRLRSRLEQDGYLVSQTLCLLDAKGRRDFSGVERALMRGVSLVIQLFGDSEVEAYLSASDVPFCLIGGRQPEVAPPRCVGRVRFSAEAALAEFAAHCRQTGVRRVTLVGKPDRCPRIAAALHANGLRTECHWQDYPWADDRRFEVAFQAGFRVAQQLVRLRRQRPKVLFVLDDYVATGVLEGLSAADVRIPEDIRVVTFATGGCGPFFRKPVTSIEFDAYAAGESTAGWISDYLLHSKIFLDKSFPFAYSRGETC